MTIIQALGWYLPESLGGTEIYVAGLAKRLRSAGCNVLIAAPHTQSGEVRYECHDGFKVFRYPIPLNPTREECQGIHPVRGTELLHQWVAETRPDVFHCHTFVTGLGLDELQAAKAVGAKVFATTHSSSLGWLCQRGTLMRFGERLCDGVMKLGKCSACELQHRGSPKSLARIAGCTPLTVSRSLRRLPGKLGTLLGMPALIADNRDRQRTMLEVVDRFFVLTDYAKRVMLANGCPLGKIQTNRLGVSHAQIAEKPSPAVQPTKTPITVGYLGRFDPIKGVQDLVAAVQRMPRQARLRIVICGPLGGEQERRFRAELQTMLAGDDRVEFRDGVPPERVLEMLRKWDVACFPARCLEGGPTAALEAHAVGTPVIGSQIGGLAEFVINDVNGRLFEPGNVDQLSALLQAMADDPANTIDRWRLQLAPPRTMDDIAADYLEHYHGADAANGADSRPSVSSSGAPGDGSPLRQPVKLTTGVIEDETNGL